jgi:hypothetical protein
MQAEKRLCPATDVAGSRGRIGGVWYAGLASSSSPCRCRSLEVVFASPECHICQKKLGLFYALQPPLVELNKCDCSVDADFLHRTSKSVEV